ncbi:MAG: glycyl-radical enzyme activating protein [Anaerolineae bacterium]|nr:glycyl-radical enzyme activating protein [Anaerolineae bacterium]
MSKGIVFDIKKFSIHDGPGIRTTVFFKGCPLNCWWCHNPESQAMGPERVFRETRCIDCGACLAVCPQGAISSNGDGIVTDNEQCVLCGACVDACYAEARQMIGREMTVSQVMADIEKDIAFYDESGGGVTFSGGEPLSQRDFLLALLQACRAKDIHTVVDTSGFATWQTFDRIRPYVNLFLYDLKLMDDADHQKFTGVSNQLILQNLQLLSQAGHHLIVRLPIVPGINDDQQNIWQIGAFVAALPQAHPIELLPYHHIGTDKYRRLHKSYQLVNLQPPSVERMSQIAEVFRKFNLHVKIG